MNPPSPSCPSSLRPQQSPFPPSTIPHVKPLPAYTRPMTTPTAGPTGESPSHAAKQRVTLKSELPSETERKLAKGGMTVDMGWTIAETLSCSYRSRAYSSIP